MSISEQKRNIILAYPSGEKIFEKALAACKKRPPPPRRGKLESKKIDSLRCIERAFKTVDTHLGSVLERSPFIEDLHPFFRELLALSVDPDTYKKCLAQTRSVRKILRKIYLESKKRVVASEKESEINSVRRAFFGRTLSILESLNDCLGKIREFQEHFIELPEVDTSLLTIIIAGAPNVGKSSLLRALTNAKPKVSPYPFTTTKLNIGILDRKHFRIQLIDTPGLLDTPLNEKNKIERQAILAIRLIANAIIFVVDPTETCGFPLEYQKAVFDEISSSFSNLKVIKVANKMDVTRPEHVKRLELIFKDEKFIPVSAEKKLNLERLLDEIERIGLFSPQGARR